MLGHFVLVEHGADGKADFGGATQRLALAGHRGGGARQFALSGGEQLLAFAGARPPVPGCGRQSGARRGSRVRYHSPRGASGSRLADVTGNRKFVDSPLEGGGFELPVRGHR